MAELADALDLGSSEATRVGSTPSTRTIFSKSITRSPYFASGHISPFRVCYGNLLRFSKVMYYKIVINQNKKVRVDLDEDERVY